MKRTAVLILIQIFFSAGWVVGQGERLDPLQTQHAEIVLPEPPFDEEHGVEITVRGTYPEPGQKATLLAVHNLHRRITFEIEVSQIEDEADTAALRPWSVSVGLGYLAPGTYQVVAVVNGNVVDEKTLRISEPREDTGKWIVYTKSGGIAGIYRLLRVDLETRGYELTDDGQRHEGVLSLRNHLRLVGALLLCDFSRLKPVYEPPTPVVDGFKYEVQVPRYTVVGYSGAEIPRGFSYLVRTLDDLVDDILRARSPTPRWPRPEPTRPPVRPTPTETPVPTTPTPVSDEFAVSGHITVDAGWPGANGKIHAAIDLETSTGTCRVVSSTVLRGEDGGLTVNLSVAPVRPISFLRTEDTPIRTFVDLGVLEPGIYTVFLVINDMAVDQARFTVPEPVPPFLRVMVGSLEGEPQLWLEVSEYGRFVLRLPDELGDGGVWRGRLYPGELEEIGNALQKVPMEPIPAEGLPDLKLGETLVVHRDHMLLVQAWMSSTPREAVAFMSQMERFVTELRSRVGVVESLKARLTILTEPGGGEDSFTFDVAGEFPSSNYEVVWAELDVAEERNIHLNVWIEVVAPVGAMVITPWRVQMPAADLLPGAYFVKVSLNGHRIDEGIFSVISVG